MGNLPPISVAKIPYQFAFYLFDVIVYLYPKYTAINIFECQKCEREFENTNYSLQKKLPLKNYDFF